MSGWAPDPKLLHTGTEGFLHRVPVAAETRHYCQLPDPSVSSLERIAKFGPGTIWQCSCGRMWKMWAMREVYRVGAYVCRWRPFPRWYDRLWWWFSGTTINDAIGGRW